jgi:hypothetical protein
MVATTNLPRGFKAVGIFLFFGATMAVLAGTTLVWPGTVPDRMWPLNPLAYRQLAPVGRAIGIPFLFLGAALAAAGTGWSRLRYWGWVLTVAIIATQVLGNLANVIMGDVLRGSIGFLIASTLLFYLFRAKVRAVFIGGNGPGQRE